MLEHEKDNDSLSRFFQKAAQRPQITFEEGDWKKLEALLDAGQSKTISDSRFQWKTVAVSIAAFLFLSISTYIFIPDGNKEISTDTKSGKSDRIVANGKQEVPQELVVSNQYQSINKAIESTNLPQFPDGSARELSDEGSVLAIAQKQANASLKIAEQKPIVSELSSVPSLESAEAYERENAIGIQSQNNKTEGILILLPKDEMPLKMAMNDRALKHSLINKGIADFSLPTDSVHILPIQMKTPQPIKSVKVSDADSLPASDESTLTSRWSILLTLSPDFSSTGLRRFTSPGEAWGVLVYYRLNNVLSISAGAIKSNKIYRDYGSNYNPNNSSFWVKNTNGVTPYEIQGTCSVLEIPMGLQYNIHHMKRGDVYVAAGFSSYVMLKESYQYTFSTPNPGAAEGWNAGKTSYSLFSMTNFSVSYERSISKNITFGFSPYIKVPITGIGGWANIKLYSMGAAFTVRYNFQKMNRSVLSNF